MTLIATIAYMALAFLGGVICGLMLAKHADGFLEVRRAAREARKLIELIERIERERGKR